jgi:hypothetical protein
MHRTTLPRIFELRDLLRNPDTPSAYFRDFDSSIATEPVKRKHFIDIEADLQGLDPGAWDYLKHEVAPLFEQKDPARGWRAAFDKLNQAKAYIHLKRIGCTDVEFIPESPTRGQKTPDLKGQLGETKVLCEVKTINISQDEANARTAIVARSIQRHLSDAFFEKLRSTLKTAKDQMACYYPNDDARRMVYVIINFDDGLHEYVEAYSDQLRSFVSDSPEPGTDVIFDVKAAFYSATA